MLRLWLPLVLIFVMPGTAARADGDEAAVRALIADWYAELRVERLRVERTLARADVWERGWRWAWAAKPTTMTAAAAIFILERRDGEGWKILVYRSESRALSPKDKGMPAGPDPEGAMSAGAGAPPIELQQARLARGGYLRGSSTHCGSQPSG